MEGTHTEPTTVDEDRLTPLERTAHLELAEDGYDLPELADTMEEADARVAANRYLGAMRNVQAEYGANEDEYKTLSAFQQRRHDERQGPLERQLDWLHTAIKTLFGFMRPGGKKKSLNLIGGRVGMRSQTDELVVVDDDAVIAWVKECEENRPTGRLSTVTGIVVMKPRLDRKALRAFMEKIQGYDVAAPPGVTLEHRPDAFYATPAKD